MPPIYQAEAEEAWKNIRHAQLCVYTSWLITQTLHATYLATDCSVDAYIEAPLH